MPTTAFSPASWGGLPLVARCYALMLWEHSGRCGQPCTWPRRNLAELLVISPSYLRRLEWRLRDAGVLEIEQIPWGRQLVFSEAFGAWCRAWALA